MKPNWGALYFDHYVRYLDEPVDRSIYEQGATSPSIQILGFDHVFDQCLTVASLGLSHYTAEVGGVAEVVLAADSCQEFLPVLLANTLVYLVQNRLEVGWGLAVEGIEAIAPEFTSRTDKTALYLTTPVGFPDEFNVVSVGLAEGLVLQAFPISAAEMRFFAKNGAEAFEAKLGSADVDILHPNRPSVV